MKLVKCSKCGIDNLDSVFTCRKCFKSLLAVVDSSALVSDSPTPEIPVLSELPLRLVRCLDCGQAISRSAYKCVYCGKWSLRIPRIIPITGLFLFICWIAVAGYRSAVSDTQLGDSLTSTSAVGSTSALIFPKGPFNHSGIITSEVDRFNGYTDTSLKPMQVVGTSLDGLKVSAFFLSNDTSAVMFKLTSKSESWKYLDCKIANFLVDGVPFSPGQMEYDGTVGKGYVIEYFSWDMPIAKFLQMVNARSVEVKICNDVYGLSPDHVYALRDLASRIPH